MPRTHRAPAAFAALVGLVLGLLMCGAGAVAHARQTAAAAVSVGGFAAVSATGSAAGDAERANLTHMTDLTHRTDRTGLSDRYAETVDVPDAPGRAPGCGRGHGGGKGAMTPGVPPRTPAPGELLSVPSAADRAVCGGWGEGLDGLEPAPGPDPPELVPPSPLELSILRV
ncbi:hypothetical protein [Streptomyces laurentii]|uniref:hypothetical protein n=1 Tax=Streptomyces laurentii TaxID=39478 RepID=UPI0036CFF071